MIVMSYTASAACWSGKRRGTNEAGPELQPSRRGCTNSLYTTMNPADPAHERIDTQCCIAGGGPAGVMLGFLLARAGVEVVVLEKHKDFFRDFRGDTIHPSTLELMHELGLLEEFLRVPHQEMRHVEARFGEHVVHLGDFTHLPTHCKFIAFMPQWDFLNFLCEHAKQYPGFHLRMEAEVTDLVLENGRVAGVKARTPQGELEVRAALVVGADGRSSTVRERAGLEVIDLGAPPSMCCGSAFQERRTIRRRAFGFVGARHHSRC